MAATTTTTPSRPHAPVKVAFFDAKGYDRDSFNDNLKQLGLEGQFEFVYFEPHLDKTTVLCASGCEAICCFVNDDLSAEIIAALDALNVRLITMRCAGFDRVDVAACAELNMSVCRVPAYSPYAVAEFAVALLMSLNRKTHRAYNRVRDGNFTLSGLVGFDIWGKTVGVVGTGKIGQCFINIMLGFGCKILCYDVFVNEQVKALPNVTYVPFETLCKESDIISVHAPLTKDTHHMINRHTINLMKPGVYIINTSRGGLIDSKALVDGLVSSRIGGAGLDVYENEGKYFFRDTSDEEIEDEVLARLQNMKNVVFTSHQAFLTREALNAIATTTIKNLKEYFSEGKRETALANYVPPPPENPALRQARTRRASSGSSKATAAAATGAAAK